MALPYAIETGALLGMIQGVGRRKIPVDSKGILESIVADTSHDFVIVREKVDEEMVTGVEGAIIKALAEHDEQLP